MTETVWVSDSFLNVTIMSKLSVIADILFPSDMRSESSLAESERLEKIQHKYKTGVGLLDEEIYSQAYGNFPERRIKALPHFFLVNQFFVVSTMFAAVLSRFDLGKGGLFPMELFQGNRTERIPGEWYFLNLGCVKRAFLPEKSSSRCEQWPNGQWCLDLPKDDEIAVSSSALDGCDLWVDPQLTRVFFLSGRLEAALKAAKLTRTLRRARCTVVHEG